LLSFSRKSPPVRPAGGHFLLRAEEKVTKEKGLNTDLTDSPGYSLRTQLVPLTRSLATDDIASAKVSVDR
jgi:hypothetical protein